MNKLSKIHLNTVCGGASGTYVINGVEVEIDCLLATQRCLDTTVHTYLAIMGDENYSWGLSCGLYERIDANNCLSAALKEIDT